MRVMSMNEKIWRLSMELDVSKWRLSLESEEEINRLYEKTFKENA
jgi:hypothetical protein